MTGLSGSVSALLVDGVLWFRGDDLVGHLRLLEVSAAERSVHCRALGERDDAIGFFATSETARRLADGLVLTQMAAMDEASERRKRR